METQTVTLAEFLLARIAEDEAAALKAQGRRSGHWTRDGGIYDGHPMNEVVDWVYDDAWDHIARFDPARILADCEAKRRIVEYGQRAVSEPSNDGIIGYQAAISDVLRALALPFADHPDYDESWRP